MKTELTWILTAALTLGGCVESDDSETDGDGSGDNGGNGSPGDKYSGASGPAPTLTTDVPGGKTLGDLSADEARQLCEDVVESVDFEAIFEGKGCLFLAVPTTMNEADCQKAVDACLAAEAMNMATAEPDMIEPDSDKCSESITDKVKDCDVTVAEYLDCTNETFSQIQEGLNALSCANAGQMMATDVTAAPPCAKEIAEKCPSLTMGDSDSSDSGEPTAPE